MQCPWSQKGLVMRILNERLADRDVDLTDGIKLFDERGWVQVLPDPDEPLIHLYAEGPTSEDSETLEAELRATIEEIVEHEEAAAAS
jgi:mannose-1-phosphate guanylyltransferase/phosphomannomutase